MPGILLMRMAGFLFIKQSRIKMAKPTGITRVKAKKISFFISKKYQS